MSEKPGDCTAHVWQEGLVPCPGDPLQFVLLVKPAYQAGFAMHSSFASHGYTANTDKLV